MEVKIIAKKVECLGDGRHLVITEEGRLIVPQGCLTVVESEVPCFTDAAKLAYDNDLKFRCKHWENRSYYLSYNDSGRIEDSYGDKPTLDPEDFFKTWEVFQ